MIISEKKRTVRGPESLAGVLQAVLACEHETDQSKEHFFAVGMNTKNVVQYVELVSLGILDQTIVHPREVFRFAIMRGVKCIAIGHNHPSGDCTPSDKDLDLTRRLLDAGKVLGIEVLDHVIVAPESYHSMRENGDMGLSW